MKLQNINKERYTKHLNIVIVALIISLMVLAISFGQIIISLLSDGTGSHFVYNLAGVAFAAAVCLKVVHSFRYHEFMSEVYYVWRLKQILNAIYRKLTKIKKARDEGDISAFIILNYYYQASEQLLTLDNNTITMDSLKTDQDTLQSLIQSSNLKIQIEDYHTELLNAF
ncbi:MAG: hypothetical protein ACJA0E_000120 [Bermanella sp.]|jgi:hypothetical protein